MSSDDAMAKAAAILAHGENTSYPSRSSAQHVRAVMAQLVEAHREACTAIQHESDCVDAGDAEISRLQEALRNLTFAARTSGGTAGRDDALCKACDEAEAALSTSNQTES